MMSFIKPEVHNIPQRCQKFGEVQLCGFRVM